MAGKFMVGDAIQSDRLPWGTMRWISRPHNGGEKLTVIDVILRPGEGHAFHKHPDQEEVIYVVQGEVEQWLEKKSRLLAPGEAAFIPAGVVHASFNVGDAPARVVAILGPCVGADGYELVEVADQEPWKGLR